MISLDCCNTVTFNYKLVGAAASQELHQLDKLHEALNQHSKQL
jgi:hypothetical protein